MGENNRMDMTPEEKREARRKRRIRNQVLSYIGLVVVVLLIAAGAWFGYSIYGKILSLKQEAAQSSQDKINDFVASEEVLTTPEPTPQPTPTVIPLTPEEQLDEIVDAIIEVMPIEDKVAGLFVITPEALTGVGTAVKAGDSTKDALMQYAVGGLVYFSKNIKNEEQLKEMLDNTDLYAKYPLFLAIDEEGGSVSRLGKAGLGEKVEAAGVIGATKDANVAYEAGTKLAASLKNFGFNLNFAPVADVADVANSVIGDRSFGADPALVGEMVAALAKGLEDQNIFSCLKHFPGMGNTVQDPHDGLSAINRTEEEFRNIEFPAFKAGIDAGASLIMIATSSASGLTGNNEPCVFSSKVVTEILREELGYKGVIITDALNMGAIAQYYGSAEAAVMALRAGCDMILMPENFQEAYEGVMKAVQEGQISEERINDALKRIYRLKYREKYLKQAE